MDTNTPTDEFPSNVPPKLIEKFIQEKRSYSALARRLSTRKFTMNKATVHNLIKNGIEPTNGDIRVRLFLKRKYRKAIPKWVKDGKEFLKHAEEKAPKADESQYTRHGKKSI